jgi:hypothetical protein
MAAFICGDIYGRFLLSNEMEVKVLNQNLLNIPERKNPATRSGRSGRKLENHLD